MFGNSPDVKSDGGYIVHLVKNGSTNSNYSKKFVILINNNNNKWNTKIATKWNEEHFTVGNKLKATGGG